ncbi:hypothetical protein WG66_011359, partial [Moniliophthora roreri]
MKLRKEVSKSSLGIHSGALFSRYSGSFHLTLMKSSTQSTTTNGPSNKHIILSSCPTHKFPPLPQLSEALINQEKLFGNLCKPNPSAPNNLYPPQFNMYLKEFCINYHIQ